jgi:hypothetical protein
MTDEQMWNMGFIPEWLKKELAAMGFLKPHPLPSWLGGGTVMAFAMASGPGPVVDKPVEQWRAVFDGTYEVSDAGNVRRAKPGIATFVGRPLMPLMSAGGYAQVALALAGQSKVAQRRVYIHRLVMEAFCGPCPDGHAFNHKNGNKLDNNLTNPEYVTYSGNSRHALDNLPRRRGPKKPVEPLKGPQTGDMHWSRRMPEKVARGERMGASKLTAEQVQYIKTSVANGPRGTQRRVAAELGISVAQCSRIVRGVRWSHVK